MKNKQTSRTQNVYGGKHNRVLFQVVSLLWCINISKGWFSSICSFRDPDCQRLFNYQPTPLKLEAEKTMGKKFKGGFWTRLESESSSHDFWSHSIG